MSRTVARSCTMEICSVIEVLRSTSENINRCCLKPVELALAMLPATTSSLLCKATRRDREMKIGFSI